MRILYSLPHPADKLGSEAAGHTVRAAALLGAIEKLGHEVIRLEAAASGEGSGSQVAVKAYRNVVKKVIPRPVAMRMRDAGRIAYGEQYAQRLINKVAEVQPDVILETHIAFSRAGRIASAETGIPLVMDDVSPAWEEEQQYGVGLKQQALDIHKEVTGQAKLLVAVNRTIRRYLIDEGQPEDKVVVVENGINSQYFHLGVDGSPRRAAFGLKGDTVVIVFVGSFQPYHRVDLLIEAFARMQTARPAHLLLVGEGRETPAARAMAEKLNVMDRVTFAGRAVYEDVASYVAAGDIAIMPATNEYGNPMKVYEYMALGKAVMAPDQPTITEIVTHGQNAYLFEKENIDSMAAALTTVIEDNALRTRLGEQAGKDAVLHTWHNRAETLQDAMIRVGIG